MNLKQVSITILIAFTLLLLAVATGNKISVKEQQQTVKIAIPYNKFIRHVDSNYYTLWLEDKSGLNIEFEYIQEKQTDEYLRLLFSSGNSDYDAVFLHMDGEDSHLSDETIHQYGDAGYILPIDSFIDSKKTNLGELFNDFIDYDLRSAMTATDGHIYYMPRLSTAHFTGRYSMLWMNIGWIKALGLELPRTTDQLYEVLTAFALGDPNGNGIQDEIPLAGCTGVYAKQTYNLIMNSFVYNDPQNSRMFVENGKVIFAPTTEQWRQGLSYLANLYGDGLLPNLNFTYSENQLTQLANDPRDAVGAFSAKSITDVLFAASTETLTEFTHLPPLSGPDGVKYSVISTPFPTSGGIITSSCKNPEAVFDLMDLMLSEEASLIACYGEQGVDWDFAIPGDINVVGMTATINVKMRMANKVQNKHLAGLGPIVIRSEYADGLTWSGLEADNEYIDSRAAIIYRQFEPIEYIPTIIFSGTETQELRRLGVEIERYVDEMMKAFITGEKNPNNNDDWEIYLAHYETLQLERFRIAVQSSYDTTRYWRGIG